MTTNARFTEYVTSGAFNLSLSRNQISALGLISAGDGALYGNTAMALERKGLVEPVADPTERDPEGLEYRLTMAGLVCLNLLAQAGLTNQTTDPVADELAALRKEIEWHRQLSVDLRQRVRSAFARKDEAERELERANREIRRLTVRANAADLGVRLKASFDDNTPVDISPTVTLKDPLPHLSDEEVADR